MHSWQSSERLKRIDINPCQPIASLTSPPKHETHTFWTEIDLQDEILDVFSLWLIASSSVLPSSPAPSTLHNAAPCTPSPWPASFFGYALFVQKPLVHIFKEPSWMGSLTWGRIRDAQVVNLVFEVCPHFTSHRAFSQARPAQVAEYGHEDTRRP